MRMPGPLPAFGPAYGGGGVPAPAVPEGSLLFTGDWETGDTSQWEAVQCIESRISAVASPVAQGAYAGKFEIRDAEKLPGGDARAEVAWGVQLAAEGAEWVYDWHSMFDESFPTIPGKWQVITQFKSNDANTPPLKFEVDGDTLKLMGGPQVEWAVLHSFTFPRGVWMHFRVRAKWSENPAVGWVSLWVDDVLEVDQYAMANLYEDTGNYFKMGLYRDDTITQTGIVYHDGLTIRDVA